MNSSVRVGDFYLSKLAKNWGWLLLWGFLLIVLGTIAICATALTTIVSVMFLGGVILAGGIVVLVDSFKTWWGKWDTFLLHFLISILYIVVGGMLIADPVSSSVSLTLLLGIFYTFIGVYRLVYASTTRIPRWGWSFFNGLISLLLGVLILANWPGSSLVIIGLFVGIDLIFLGWFYVMMALSARNLVE